MNIQESLEAKLSGYKPEYLEILNESSQHSGPSTESHFKITIVSNEFEDMGLLKRSRSINKLCEDEITAIHAFSVFAYTPKEWVNKKDSPKSPKCGG